MSWIFFLMIIYFFSQTILSLHLLLFSNILACRMIIQDSTDLKFLLRASVNRTLLFSQESSYKLFLLSMLFLDYFRLFSSDLILVVERLTLVFRSLVLFSVLLRLQKHTFFSSKAPISGHIASFHQHSSKILLKKYKSTSKFSL